MEGHGQARLVGSTPGDIEQEATALRSFQPLLVPGLLQDEDYARGVYDGNSQLTVGESSRW